MLRKPIDHTHLQALLDRYLSRDAGDAVDEDIGYLSSRFLAGLVDRQQRMNDALASHDLGSLQLENHQIKGTAGAMGYPLLTEQAAVLEQHIRSDVPDWQRIHAGLEKLNDMINRALAEKGQGHGDNTGSDV